MKLTLHIWRQRNAGEKGRMVRYHVHVIAHGPRRGTTVCQLHMRSFKDGDVLYLEPWRARAFPIVKDMVVNRGAFDRIIAAGGFITAPTGAKIMHLGVLPQGQPVSAR